ncbi:MAG: glycosyltransferase [Leucobacter sp.]
MARISVLVPIFNVEKFLRECLDSVVDQTFRDLEIICINDGSTDGSLGIIEEYASRDSRIVVIDKPNSGYGDSMNRGLERATGDYIAIVESDDWIELDMFEQLHGLAVEHGAEVVKSNYYTYYTDPTRQALSGEKIQLVRPEEAGRVIDPSKNIDIFFQQPAIWSAIYSRQFLNSNGIKFLPTPGASYQDTSFAFKVWSSAHRVFYTTEAYLHYRRDNDASSVNNPGKVFCVADEYQEIERFIIERKMHPQIHRVMRVTKWGAYNWNIDRLTADLAPEFIELASMEYRKDRDAGKFNFELCDVNQARSLSELMDNPSRVIERKRAQEAAKVTIIVPIYNVEAYLRPCLDSILGQTIDELEVIIIDDGSVDESSEIAEDYFRADSRVQLINQRNSGQASARNRGLAHAHAQFVTFIDGDDFYEPDSLEKMRDAMIEQNVDFVVGSIRPIFESGIRSAMEKFQDQHYYQVRKTGKHQVDGDLLRELDSSVCNKMFRKEHIENSALWFPDGLRYEDAYFVNAYGLTSRSVFFLDPEDYVYNYIRRAGSTMSTTFAGSNASKDHLEIAFGLLKVIEQNRQIDVFGQYYMWLLRQYSTLAFLHAAEGDEQELWRLLRWFITENRETLSKMDDYALGELERYVFPGYLGRLSHVPRLRGAILRAGSRARQSIHSLLPTISLAYRAQRNLLAHINLLRSQLDGASGSITAQLNSQSRRIAEISLRLDALIAETEGSATEEPALKPADKSK